MPQTVDPPSAEPLSAMIEPGRTALLLIDVQVDFASPNGAAARGGADLSGAPAVLARIDALIDAARGVGASVAFARVVTRPQTDSNALKRFNARSGGAPQAIALCRAGESGADYHGVRPEPGDIEVEKRLFNSFHETDLDRRLRARGIDTLVLAGFTTDCCVDATARDAFHRDYNVFVVADATDAYGAEDQRAALRALGKSCALIVEAAEVMAAWNRVPPEWRGARDGCIDQR